MLTDLGSEPQLWSDRFDPVVGQERSPGRLGVRSPLAIDGEVGAVLVERYLHCRDVRPVDVGRRWNPIQSAPVAASRTAGDLEAVELAFVGGELDTRYRHSECSDGHSGKQAVIGDEARIARRDRRVPVPELQRRLRLRPDTTSRVDQRDLEAVAVPDGELPTIDDHGSSNALEPARPFDTAVGKRSDRLDTIGGAENVGQLGNRFLGRGTEVDRTQATGAQHRHLHRRWLDRRVDRWG